MLRREPSNGPLFLMSLWFVLALMTAAAVFAVLWPLGRSRGEGAGGSELAVYKDQLAEIERDRTLGLIGDTEAEAARVEIGRRVIAAGDRTDAVIKSSPLLRRSVAVLALVGMPVLAVVIYLAVGSPQLPDQPLADRRQAPAATASLETLVGQVEAHLEKVPNDAKGWQVLAPVLMRLGRYEDAVRAFRNTLTYGGETADRHSDLGEAMTAASGGVVTAEAKTEFERAVALDSSEVKARYFIGLAAEQDGRKDDAATTWKALLASAPADAPWRPLVEASLSRIGAAAPGPSAEDMAAASAMPQEDRQAMVRGMVERLATRLKQNGDDVDGWLRLVRAYMVLGETDKAKAASTDARQALGNDQQRLDRLKEGLKGLGLDG